VIQEHPDGGTANNWPSIDDARPPDQGGQIARSGFSFQDEVAVGFLLEMLESPSVLRVHCETHDDVVVIRSLEEVDEAPSCLAEYVQVKGGEPDKLWSAADLCRRENGKVGTSIYEMSLARDKHRETSRFRLVTARPVVSALEILTLQFKGPGRKQDGAAFDELSVELEERCPDSRSAKGNGCAFWLENCVWDVRHGEVEVRRENLLRILWLGVREVQPLLPEHAEVLLNELRILVQEAGAAKWEVDRNKKIITREALHKWWDQRISDIAQGVSALAGGKLREKMAAAALPEDLIELAVEMRRDYAYAARTPRYMELEEGERLQNRVKSELVSLEARRAAGQVNVNAASFHAMCLDRMDVINGELQPERGDHSGFLKGCMYDIADRCLLRFARVAQ